MLTHEDAEHKMARVQSVVDACVDLIENSKNNALLDQLLALLELTQDELTAIHHWIESTEFPPAAKAA